MKKTLILIADDESDMLELLSYNLVRAGYRVIEAGDGEEAIEQAEKHEPDVILLDVQMPKIDGITACRMLRERSKFKNTLVIFLTSRAEEYSEVAGFEAGADDYITKPVKLRSLVSRLEALQRRRATRTKEQIQYGPFLIDQEKYLVYKDGVELRMPRKEFELLTLLMQHRGHVVSREQIMEEVWGQGVMVLDRTIDVHVRRIRIKIGEHQIETIKGIGFKFLGI